MKKMLKDRGINETPATIKGNTEKLHALPEDVREYYLKTYNTTRSSNMKFKNEEKPNL